MSAMIMMVVIGCEDIRCLLSTFSVSTSLRVVPSLKNNGFLASTVMMSDHIHVSIITINFTF